MSNITEGTRPKDSETTAEGWIKGLFARTNRASHEYRKIKNIEGHGAGAFMIGRRVLIVSTLAMLTLSQPLNAKQRIMQCTIKNGQVVDSSGQAMQNCTFVSGGKTYAVVDGKAMLLTKSMTMADGTQCLPDGTCIAKSGKKIKLTEGHGFETPNGNYFRVRGLMPPGSFSNH